MNETGHLEEITELTELDDLTESTRHVESGASRGFLRKRQPKRKSFEFGEGPSKKEGPLTEEDLYIVTNADRLKKELDFLHNRFNEATDPFLVDSLIYEIQAAQLRYKFYLELCKERGIIWKR